MDTVNHPAHYGGDTPTEPIKVIEAWGLGFHLGNTVKYIARAGKKGSELEDLRKARWYLDRRIEVTEAEERQAKVTTSKGDARWWTTPAGGVEVREEPTFTSEQDYSDADVLACPECRDALPPAPGQNYTC